MQQPKSATSLVLFDCDGVLVDSEPIANRLFHAHLVGLGLRLTPEETNDRFMGRSMKEGVAIVEVMLGHKTAAADWLALEDATRTAFDAELQRVPGITAVLDTLTLPFCVASSGGHAKIRHSLGLTGLLPRFEGKVFSADDVTRGKPAPDLFLHAASVMGCPPSRCTVVEDSVPGVEAACAAGMRVLGFCATTPAERLQRAGAELFADMKELPVLLHL